MASLDRVLDPLADSFLSTALADPRTPSTGVRPVEKSTTSRILSSLVATVVKLSKRGKDRLDRLQARLLHWYGRKVTKQETLEALLDLLGGREEELVARLVGVRYPIPDAEWRRILGRIEDWGVETSPEDVDRVLYGARRT